MRVLLYIFFGVAFLSAGGTPDVGHAQIVSLLVDSESQAETQVMEKALKVFLFEEGYEVKKITSGEGFFLYVQFMSIRVVQEQLKVKGYVGNVFIGSQAWTKVVDSFMPANCNTEKYRKMKNHVGMEMVLLDSKIFTDSSVEGLAELMSSRANSIIRGKSSEMTALIKQFAGQ